MHQVFGKEFIKTGKISKELGSFLISNFELRQASDYEISTIIEEVDVKQALEKATEFVDFLRKELMKP